MNRLTEKYDDGSYGISECTCEVEKKLGPLEDFEEELEIDLVTLFKALKNGIYTKDRNEWIYAELFYTENVGWVIGNPTTDYEYFNLKDYGKTWALTREELEK